MAKPSFAIIGLYNSEYTAGLLSTLTDHDLRPEYVIIEDKSALNISNSKYAYSVKSKFSPTLDGKWDIHQCANSVIAFSLAQDIPYFAVEDQNSDFCASLLSSFPVDYLVISEGPIFKGKILYRPRIGVLNVHAAQLPKYRGNWTTFISAYNDDEPTVTAYIVTPWVDQGPIIATQAFKVPLNCTLGKLTSIATANCFSLLCRILSQDIPPKVRLQQIWEGNVYKGRKRQTGSLDPSFPDEFQKKLSQKLSTGWNTYVD